MAQLGINLVRFHHMDNRDIWESNEESTLSQEKLDILHYFIFCLHKHGIYININLHVSREYPEVEYSKAPKEFRERFNYGKVLDKFYPPFIRDQLNYARDLLNSFNKYMKSKVGEDPMLLNIELNNENTMMKLLDIDNLNAIKGTKFHTELSDQWAKWLEYKYTTFDDLFNGWNPNPLDKTHDFLPGLKIHIQKDDNTVVTEEGDMIRFSINQTPEKEYGNQILYQNIKVKAATFYTVEFEAKGIPKKTSQMDVRFTFQENGPPYGSFSKQVSVSISSELKKYSVVLQTKESIETAQSPMAFKIILPPITGEYEIKNVHLFEGDEVFTDFYKGEKKFENVFIPDVETYPNLPIADFCSFIQFTEEKTQQNLTSYIKKAFPNANIYSIDSQANYGNILSFEREYRNADFTDTHSYWQHPKFDPGFDWDKEHFSIKNTPMFNDSEFGSFKTITAYKIFNRPYTVSEYNHAFPNEHLHEKFPMLASWAAFHDWDAIYQFSYDQTYAKSGYIYNYFTMSTNPIDYVMAPFLTYAFREYYVSTSKNYVHAKLPKSKIVELNKQNQISFSGYGWLEGHLGFYPGWNALFDVEIVEAESSKVFYDSNINIEEQGKFITDEISWTDTYQINAPMLRTITGWIGDSKKSIENNLGVLKMKMVLDETLKESATIGVLSLDKKELEESSKIYLAVVGKIMNTDQEWNSDRTSTAAKWGNGPLLAQFIDFDCTLLYNDSEKPTVWTLNQLGEKNETLEVTGKKGNWKFSSDFSKPSLAFLIERSPSAQPESESNSELESKTEPESQQENSSQKILIISLGILIPVVVVVIVAIVAFVIIRKKRSNNDLSDGIVPNI